MPVALARELADGFLIGTLESVPDLLGIFGYVNALPKNADCFMKDKGNEQRVDDSVDPKNELFGVDQGKKKTSKF